MSMPELDSQLDFDDQDVMDSLINHTLHSTTTGFPINSASASPEPEPELVPSNNSGRQSAGQIESHIGAHLADYLRPPDPVNNAYLPAILEPAAETQAAFDSDQSSLTPGLPFSTDHRTHDSSAGLPAFHSQSNHSTLPDLLHEALDNGEEGSLHNDTQLFPHGPSGWADLMSYFKSLGEVPIRAYNGRGCVNCTRSRKQSCECRLICSTDHNSLRARDMLVENGTITFFNLTKAKGKLHEIEQKLNLVQDLGAIYNTIRDAQRLKLDMMVGQVPHKEAARLNTNIKGAPPMVADDHTDQESILQLDSLRKIVHYMWYDPSEVMKPLFEPQEKLVFASIKFICLWTLLSKYHTAEVSVPHIDKNTTFLLSGNSLSEPYRLGIQRKAQLVAFGLLESLIHYLHAAFKELMSSLDDVASINGFCELKASELEGSRRKAARPYRTLRYCLLAIVDAIENTPFAWPCEDTEVGRLLKDLQTQLTNAGDDLRHQLALYECYTGHMTETAAKCVSKPTPSSKPAILRFKKNDKSGGKTLPDNLLIRARMANGQATESYGDIQQFSEPRSTFDILSETSVEGNASAGSEIAPCLSDGITGQVYDRTFSSIEQFDHQTMDVDDDFGDHTIGSTEQVHSQPTDTSAMTTKSTHSVRRRPVFGSSDHTNTETEITSPGSADPDLRSNSYKSTHSRKRPAESSAPSSTLSSSSSLSPPQPASSKGNSRSVASRSRSFRRAAKRDEDHGAHQALELSGIGAFDTAGPSQDSVASSSDTRRSRGGRAWDIVKDRTKRIFKKLKVW